jgi:hypothetical protein
MLEVLSVSVFYGVAALLVLASAVGMIGVLLRQPLIVSFIAVGQVLLMPFLEVMRKMYSRSLPAMCWR